METETKPKSRKKTPARKPRAKKAAPIQATPVEEPKTPEKSEGSSTKSLLMQVKDKMKITKVTATRCVKTKRGDHFVAFSSEWDSFRDDSEHGVIDENSSSGMDLKEATIALSILQFKADTAAIEGAYLAGDITLQDRDHEIRSLRTRYGTKLKELTNE